MTFNCTIVINFIDRLDQKFHCSVSTPLEAFSGLSMRQCAQPFNFLFESCWYDEWTWSHTVLRQQRFHYAKMTNFNDFMCVCVHHLQQCIADNSDSLEIIFASGEIIYCPDYVRCSAFHLGKTWAAVYFDLLKSFVRLKQFTLRCIDDDAMVYIQSVLWQSLNLIPRMRSREEINFYMNVIDLVFFPEKTSTSVREQFPSTTIQKYFCSDYIKDHFWEKKELKSVLLALRLCSWFIALSTPSNPNIRRPSVPSLSLVPEQTASL